MILQHCLRRQSALRPISSSLKRVSTALAPRSRRLHGVPKLTHGEKYAQDGVPNFLTAAGFELSWTQYQGLLVDKLNLLTEGTTFANREVKDLLIATARDPAAASLFNYASMAHNNHFFFKCISPEPVGMPRSLSEMLIENFSSIDSLRLELIATAEAMFGPGFVWLVKDVDTLNFSILATYIAGSPYPKAHYRRQPIDMATQSMDTIGGLSGEDYARQTQVQNTVGSIGPSSGAPKPPPGGANIVPILCINTWEHVWLMDYGVGNKRRFAENWWNVIDWSVVYDHVNIRETVERHATNFLR